MIDNYSKIRLKEINYNDGKVESLITDSVNECYVTLPSIIKPKSESLYTINKINSDEQIGLMYLYNIDEFNRSAYIDGFTINNCYTKELIHGFIHLIRKSFSELNLNKIYTMHICGTSYYPRIFDFLKLVQEGLLRNDVNINGKYHNIYVYGLLRHEYLRNYNTENKLKKLFDLEGF